MQTLLELLNKTTTYLEQRGVESARLNSELLFAHALGCRRLDLYLQFERPLEEDKLECLRPLVRRRGAREPLQYITGTTGFYGLELRTDPRALIPRPETEELVEAALGLAEETLEGGQPGRVLDLGTGCGAIALALATHLPSAEIIGVDRSPGALELAAENAAALGLGDRVRWIESDWFSKVDGRFDLILANPPYLAAEELAEAAPEVRQHEPGDALLAAEGGLADLGRIVSGATGFLRPGGLLALETGIHHHAALAEAAALGYAHHESRPDLSGRDRFFFLWAAAPAGGG